MDAALGELGGPSRPPFSLVLQHLTFHSQPFAFFDDMLAAFALGLPASHLSPSTQRGRIAIVHRHARDRLAISPLRRMDQLPLTAVWLS